jgi:hypothetical protein
MPSTVDRSRREVSQILASRMEPNLTALERICLRVIRKDLNYRVSNPGELEGLIEWACSVSTQVQTTSNCILEDLYESCHGASNDARQCLADAGIHTITPCIQAVIRTAKHVEHLVIESQGRLTWMAEADRYRVILATKLVVLLGTMPRFFHQILATP